MKKLIIFLIAAFVASSCVVKQEDIDAAKTGAVIQFAALGNPAPPARVATNARVEGIVPMDIPKCDESAIADIFLKIYMAEDTTLIFANKLQVQYFPSIGAWQAVIDNITPGDYLIGDLIALDQDDNPLFAVPHADSQYAPFVSKPAFIPFTIVNGEKTKVIADVICVEPKELPLFGVEVFQFDIISLFKFGLFANYCDSLGHHKADLFAWVEADGGPVLMQEEDGIEQVLIPDHWDTPDSLETVTVTAYIANTGTWLQATKTVEDWRDFEGIIYHLYYDCQSPLWCEPIDPPENADELLALIEGED